MICKDTCEQSKAVSSTLLIWVCNDTNGITYQETQSLIAHVVQIELPVGFGEEIIFIRKIKLIRAAAFVEVEEVLVLRLLLCLLPGLDLHANSVRQLLEWNVMGIGGYLLLLCKWVGLVLNFRRPLLKVGLSMVEEDWRLLKIILLLQWSL